MKYRVPVHVSMDLEVEISGKKNPEPSQLREAAEAAVEKKLQSMFGPSSKFSGDGRAKASPTKAKDERGQPVFRQASPRQPKDAGTRDIPPESFESAPSD
jgi:hypothetical protein